METFLRLLNIWLISERVKRMKAVVMEIKNEYAVVLKEDGTFEKIKRDCKVGDTLELSDKSASKLLKFASPKFVRAAAAGIVILGLSGSYYTVASASDYMVVTEGENEVTVGLNRFGKVVSLESENEDGQRIVDDLYEKGIKYDGVEDAITKLSIAMRDMNQDEDLEVKIDAKNDKTYKKIKQKAIEAGAVINEGKPVKEEEVETPAKQPDNKTLEQQDAETKQDKPDETKTQTKPENQQPAQISPNENQTPPVEAESSEGQSVPEQGQPVEGQPAPEQGQPSESQPAPEQGQPAESQPAEGQIPPMEGQPTGGQPTEGQAVPAQGQPTGGQTPQPAQGQMPQP